MEIALSKFCGKRDIITPISPEDEKTRKDLGYRGPQNYLAPIWDYRARDFAKVLLKKKRKKIFRNHIQARVVKARLPEQVWNSYFKFCFERNPWDRVISLYYWRQKCEPRRPMPAFVCSDAPLALKRKGFELYTIDGQIAVDKICRYEHLSDDLEMVRSVVGIPERLDIPHAKSQYRKEKRSYRELLGDRERAAIQKMFKEEIDLMGYEF